VRAANYAVMDRNDYLRSANENLVILQVEGIEGLKNFKQIIDVEGVDIVFIGPYDLSQAMGIPGKIEDPALVNEMEKLINDADKHKVVLGTFCDTPGQLLHWKRLGVKYLAYSVDINIFVEGLNSIKSNLKA
jgi:4-hydroxy-2-oxoheptanedioate aldolase